MHTQVLMASLFIVMAVSGCLGGDDPIDGDNNGGSDVELMDAMAAWNNGDDTANIEHIGMWSESGTAEIDAWDRYMAVMRGGGVDIVDIVDPTAPVTVSRTTAAPGVKDVKWSDDGEFLFTGNDDRASIEPVAQVPGAPMAGGIYVIDASDKTAPTLADTHLLGPQRGAHMVFYHRNADGTELVLGANGDISINTFTRDPPTLTTVASYRPDLLEYDRSPNVVDAYYQLTAHDMFAMYDPAAEADLMYVANWDAGLRIVDISDPSNPVELGGWNDFPDGHTGNLHTVVTEWIGDRRITAGTVEVGFNVVGGIPYALDSEPSIMYVWDTTDPTDIQLLGMWTNPDGLTTGAVSGSFASTHNIQLEDGRITMAHYGLGVWVIDISMPDLQADPKTLGYYQVSPMSTWDVLPYDGVIWSSGSEGLNALHFAADTIGVGPRGRA